jgi:hypothetical protein
MKIQHLEDNELTYSDHFVRAWKFALLNVIILWWTLVNVPRYIVHAFCPWWFANSMDWWSIKINEAYKKVKVRR